MTPTPSELVVDAKDVFDSARNREDLGDWAIEYGPRIFIEIERLSADLAEVKKWLGGAQQLLNLSVESAEKRAAKYKEVLEFYACENSWDGEHPDSLDLAGDCGKRAREALAEDGT